MLLDGYPDDPVLAETVNRLAEQPVPESVADARDRDLPVRRRLEALAAIWPVSRQGKATMRLAGEHLVDAGFAAQAGLFVASGVDWSEPETALRRLVSLGDEHPTAVPRVHETTLNMLTTAAMSGLWTADNLLAISQELAAGTEAAGLVAVAVVETAGPQSGWGQPWRELLAGLRQHESVWVQNHALNIRTAVE